MRRGEFPIASLPVWCSLNDVTFFDVKVGDIEGKGYGLVAERDLVNEEDNSESPLLLTIPKDLVLSAEAVEEYAKEDKNFRQLLEAAGHRSHRGDVLLFLMVQLILSSPDNPGAKNIVTPWTQYFSLLPAKVPIPTMWTDAELSHLRGSSLESAVAAKLSVLTKEFNDVRARSSDLLYWNDLLWADEVFTVHDWVLLDALYRSRSLGLPKSGESMVPCLDLVNHSRQSSAYFEESSNEEVTLLLREGCAVSSGQEITIDYGQGKSAAEMLFSYGFIDSDATAKSLVLPVEPTEDDPLAKAKLHVFGTPPTLQIHDSEDGVPQWTAPFIYLVCLNEEDGLNFALLQENDGSRHLRLHWQEEDVTDRAHELTALIDGHELRQIFELRAVTLIQERVEQQIKSLRDSHSNAMPGIVRAEILQTALHLRNLEADLLERAARALEDQKTRLLADNSVIAYLGFVEEPRTDEAGAALSNDEEDFS
ncbi:uncharacterized protein BCR38DRAFT_344875 [Pseudomassariella vexata]|uniref:SET domain-containing protein n=1 Tax=Pseudomassariella vexata TaxID=1141098 RepID=A0A1Y2DUV8_9PEZI|nr:uncharacterized protein BCR38DRAFT_344875 [Pseudomassariella vexata]ORY63027.1 hypothetical protein BCR38DRAFT_344875 [Pseudomassariella vexata]